jgi:hypothetical protein
MLPNAAKAKKASSSSRHPKLDSFPSLLPTIVPSSPHVLRVSSPDMNSSTRLLTGTMPLGKGVLVDDQLLKLAETCDRLGGFIDTILRGLEAVGDAFKEGEKQTMIWREELETCGEQQGSKYRVLSVITSSDGQCRMPRYMLICSLCSSPAEPRSQ